MAPQLKTLKQKARASLNNHDWMSVPKTETQLQPRTQFHWHPKLLKPVKVTARATRMTLVKYEHAQRARNLFLYHEGGNKPTSSQQSVRKSQIMRRYDAQALCNYLKCTLEHQMSKCWKSLAFPCIGKFGHAVCKSWPFLIPVGCIRTTTKKCPQNAPKIMV